MAKPLTQSPGPKQNAEKISEEQSKISTAKMNIVVFMTLLIDLLGFTVILPLMPKLLEFYGTTGSVSYLKHTNIEYFIEGNSYFF